MRVCFAPAPPFVTLADIRYTCEFSQKFKLAPIELIMDPRKCLEVVSGNDLLLHQSTYFALYEVDSSFRICLHQFYEWNWRNNWSRQPLDLDN